VPPPVHPSRRHLHRGIRLWSVVSRCVPASMVLSGRLHHGWVPRAPPVSRSCIPSLPYRPATSSSWSSSLSGLLSNPARRCHQISSTVLLPCTSRCPAPQAPAALPTWNPLFTPYSPYPLTAASLPPYCRPQPQSLSRALLSPLPPRDDADGPSACSHSQLTAPSSSSKPNRSRVAGRQAVLVNCP
jgi:hypothetical protein